MPFNYLVFCLSLWASVPTNVATSSGRIAGGSDVRLGEYVPYQISLQLWRDYGRWEHYCGGSILKADRVLTAAHCVENFNPNYFTVLAGVTRLDDASGQRSDVLRYFMHKNYDGWNRSDIAILYIRPLDLDGIRIAPILLKPAVVGIGKEVTLTGWGRMCSGIDKEVTPTSYRQADTSENYPMTLQRVELHTISNTECTRNVGMSATRSVLCAQGWAKSSCSGDFGGPLVMSTPRGPKQVGIAIYSNEVCGASTRVTSVFTRISKFIPWISTHL